MYGTTVIWAGQREAVTKQKNHQPLVLENCTRGTQGRWSSHRGVHKTENMQAASLGLSGWLVLGGMRGLRVRLKTKRSSLCLSSVWAPRSLHSFLAAERVGKLQELYEVLATPFYCSQERNLSLIIAPPWAFYSTKDSFFPSSCISLFHIRKHQSLLPSRQR